MSPMFLSAVKVVIALLAAVPGGGQVAPKLADAWKKVQPQTMVLRNGNAVAGRAALIDSRGYFIAHRTSVPAAALQGQTPDGKTYKVARAAIDDPTGLVLLIAEGWTKPGVLPVQLPPGPCSPGAPLLGVIGTGPIPSEFVSNDRFGVLAPSRRLVALSEVKLESSQQLVGGALLFTYEGQFMGALNATLGATADETPPPATSLTDKGSSLLKRKPTQSFGPSQVTVAYTASLGTLHTVIDGFKSPTHEVWRPQLGVVCKDGVGGGAQVESLAPNSPAEKGGIHIGDVIFQIATSPVHNQVDFAKAMLLQTIGADTKIGFLRRGATMVVTVKLGKSKD